MLIILTGIGYGANANKLGDDLGQNYTIMNSEEPTRKEHIIDLTIVSDILASKVTNWKVQKEIYLNSDHSLFSFDFGQPGERKIVERYDFKKADWKKWEERCEVLVGEWLSDRRKETEINDDYESFVAVLQKAADETILMKRECKHKKGWWSKTLTDLCKDFKRAKKKICKKN